MTYKEAILWMEQIQKKGSILGLVPIKTLLEKLGNPQNKLKVVHVAGTNGKGSICTFLEEMYKAEGKHVGRYISPTLCCYLERFQINGSYMTEEEFAKLLSDVVPVIEQLEQNGVQVTAFEVETAIAFLYFLEENTDIVILETGMGGRQDATNVVAHPVCTVFASIGMDHMQFLGSTIEEIAYEKAGIMRENCPVVSYPNASAVMQVLKQEFCLCNGGKDQKQLFGQVAMSDIAIISEDFLGSTFRYKGELYQIGLAGRYQIYNAATAIAVKEMVDGALPRVDLKSVKWPGRFEMISEQPLFFRDGAHNIDGVKALKESIEKHFTNRKIIFIIGVLRDKEYEKMMELLCPMASRIFTITPQCERGLPAEVLRSCIQPYCEQVEACDSLEKALTSAKMCYADYEKENVQSVILAWGSLSYIGQIK